MWFAPSPLHTLLVCALLTARIQCQVKLHPTHTHTQRHSLTISWELLPRPSQHLSQVPSSLCVCVCPLSVSQHTHASFLSYNKSRVCKPSPWSTHKNLLSALVEMGLRNLKIVRPSLSHRSQAKDDDLICVSGSWSFLGSWIVKLLLHHGYHVKSTIPHTPEEIRVLRSLPQSEMRLELAEVDLLDYGSLSDLFAGCTGVFYVPSPNYDINGTGDYPVEIINNEVRGVLNVVEACANTSSIRKLVLTSCLSSVLWDRQYYSTGVVLNEKNWSDMDFCRKEKMWAALCKTQSEKAAWALARDRGLDLVVMNPAVVTGPNHSYWETDSSMLDKSGIFAFVHVDDLAAAHVLAFEAEHASGRYICFEKLLSKDDILEAAKEMYPDYPIAKRLESFKPCLLSNEKLKGLGMSFEQRIIEGEV